MVSHKLITANYTTIYKYANHTKSFILPKQKTSPQKLSKYVDIPILVFNYANALQWRKSRTT